MTSECVRTDLILPRGAGLEHGRCKQSIFSLSIFGILVLFVLFCFIEFKGFPRQDLRSPDRGDLRNGFVVCDCELVERLSF